MKNTPIEQGTPITGKGLLQTAVICAFLALVLCLLNPVFMSNAGNANILAGQAKKDRRYDVIFAGSSHMNNALYPMQLWENYGFSSFNNAQSGEIIPVNYYTCKEVIEKYAPKVVVLDVYMLYHKRKWGNITWMHQSLDRLSAKNRLSAIFDLVPVKNLEEFLFPLSLYHTRWKELAKSDFVPTDTARRGCAQNFALAKDIEGLSFEYQPPNVKRHPPKVAVAYLDKIVELCKKTGTELVLVAVPYFISGAVKGATHNLKNDQAYFNWTADYAKQRDIPYINYFHLVGEIGFEWNQCLYNHSHMNYRGGSIITDHLGKYLWEHYNLPDRRKDPDYAHWNEDLKIYKEQLKKNLTSASWTKQ